MNNINLSALGDESDTGYRAVQSSTVSQLRLLFYFLLIIPIFLFIALSLFESPLFFLGAILALVLFLKFRQKNIKSDAIFQRLAMDNSWKTDVAIPSDITDNFPALGIERKKKMVAGIVAGKEFWMLHDDKGSMVLVKSNKRLAEAYFFNSTINSPMMRIGFDQMLTNVGLERLSLEGNFDKSLVLYAKPETRLDVLSVVAPDFMMSLLDSGSVSLVAMNGNYVAIASYSPSVEHLRDLLETAEAVANQLR